MKKLIVFFLISCFMNFSCQDGVQPSSTIVCGKQIDELPWLQKIIEEAEVGTVKIYKVKKGGETYIVPFFCCYSCNYVIALLDCNGDAIGYLNDGKVSNEDLNNSKISQLIWEPEQFKCIDE